MDNIYNIDLIPENDAERVAALERYQIVNSQREVAFDSICELACELFSCPISHISFLNADIEFIKAGVGLGGMERISRTAGFCAYAILQPEPLLIEDTLQSPIFSNHPYVIGELKIRFYAAAPVITPDGFIIGTMCLIDTVPRKLMDKELKLLEKLAKRAMEQTELRYNNLSLVQQRDDFIAAASHEMRTPLTALKASLQLLNNKQPNDNAAVISRLVRQANKSAGKLSQLVNELFDASRMAEKKFALQRSEFLLTNLIKQASEFMDFIGKHKLKVVGNTDINILADERKIEQVIVNILENAIKYAPDCGIIELAVEETAGFVRIMITDKGPGIAPGNLPHIFRRYFRSETDPVKTGLGLGLYICAEIIKEHGGNIGVESELGKGTTFWFTLPISTIETIH